VGSTSSGGYTSAPSASDTLRVHAVARLMLEVPDPLPPEAVAAADRSDQHVIREIGGGVIAAFAAFLLYVPIMLAQGVRDPLTVAAIAVVSATMLAWAWRWRAVGPHVFAWTPMLGAALVLALYTRTLGPFINAPAQAALAAMAVCFFPRAPHPSLVLATFVAPTVGVYGLELTGVLRPTTRGVDGAVVVTSPAVELGVVSTYAGLMFVTVALVVLASLIAGGLARSHAKNVRQLVSRRWIIRQLAAVGDDEPAVGDDEPASGAR